MFRKLLLTMGLLGALALPGLAQTNIRTGDDAPVLDSGGHPVSNALLTVCTNDTPAGQCVGQANVSNQIQLYTGPSGGTCSSPNTNCQPITTDFNGDWHTYLPAGTYQRCTQARGVLACFNDWTIGASGGGGGGGLCPSGAAGDVQFTNGTDCVVDTGIFTHNGTTHTTSTATLDASNSINVSGSVAGEYDLQDGPANTFQGSNWIGFMAPTSGTGARYIFPGTATTTGYVLIAGTVSGTDVPLTFVPVTSLAVAISCENVPTLMGCNAPSPATTNDVTYTLYPATDDYVFKVPPPYTYGSSILRQTCAVTNLGSPPTSNCVCTYALDTMAGTLTLGCTIPHLYPGDSILASSGMEGGFGYTPSYTYSDSQGYTYTALDNEGASDGTSGANDAIAINVAGDVSDTVQIQYTGVTADHFSELDIMVIRGVTGVDSHHGAIASSASAAFGAITTSHTQTAIVAMSYENTFGNPGCSYAAGTNFQMLDQDAVTNGSFGNEAIVKTTTVSGFTPTMTRNGCSGNIDAGVALDVALIYTGVSSGSDIPWLQRFRYSTLVTGGDFDPLGAGDLLYSADGQRVTTLSLGTGLSVSAGQLVASGSIVASGTSTMGTSAISSGACATTVTTTATGAATTSKIVATPSVDPQTKTGYAVSASGSLSVYAYPTSNAVHFEVCNGTGSTITPAAITFNWAVL